MTDHVVIVCGSRDIVGTPDDECSLLGWLKAHGYVTAPDTECACAPDTAQHEAAP